MLFRYENNVSQTFRWGCQHEDTARSAYCETLVQEMHTEGGVVKIFDSGLHLSPDYPYLGATPDGLISCTCCGEGVLEIKCPYCSKEQSIQESAQLKSFCLSVVDDSGNMRLERSHSYYYQVQLQMALTHRSFCHLVIWTPTEMYCERIEKDLRFIEEKIASVAAFMKKCVMPELVAKYFTKRAISNNGRNDSQICYCKEARQGNILTCSNSTCKIKKFHQNCVGLKNKPRKQWFCCECKVAMKRIVSNSNSEN